MHDSFPIRPEALYILHAMQSAGFECAIVGGAVRDTILENARLLTDQTDYDFATNATPEQIQAVFSESFCENEFGTVSVTQENLLEELGVSPEVVIPTPTTLNKQFSPNKATKLHASLETYSGENLTPSSDREHSRKKLIFEITTYRSHETYSNFRQPNSLQWGSSLSEDLTRRDFACNALALRVSPEYLATIKDNWFDTTQHSPLLPNFRLVPKTAITIIDEHDGLQDLKDHLLNTVGVASERFKEDALRMLRAIRFSVQLNLKIHQDVLLALTENAELLPHISAERVRDELLKMLESPFPKEAIELLDSTGLLKHVLPELLLAKGVEQGGHHTTDVWVHSLDALASCPSPDPIVRLATLLHDVGKPPTLQVSGDGPTFYNHEVVGARLAKSIAYRLKLSKRDTDRIFLLVRHHMFHYQPENSDAAIRRFMRKVGLTNLDDILALREGDRLGSGARKTSWRLEEMKERMQEQLHQPMDLRDLAINGSDLINELELNPGPIIGKILNHLFEQVLENPELNEQKKLLSLAREFVASL